MPTAIQASALSAPPKPAFPDLSRPLAPEELTEAFRRVHGSYYSHHPFHVLMYEGKLSKKQLQGWVVNRLAYQRVISRKNAAILSNCPSADIRRDWMKRIVDHDGTEPGTGGIEIWTRLGEAMGVPREEMDDDRHVLPGVRFATEAYVTFCKNKTWIEGVACTLTEQFAPDLMRQRLEAFPRHYPWVKPEGLAYFKGRVTQAPLDSQQAIRLLQQFCTTADAQRRAFEAFTFHLEVLWVMIDTIHHGYMEP